MRIHIIACRVLTRELCALAAVSPNTVEITWMPQGLHDTPDKMRVMLQRTLEDIERQREERLSKHDLDYIALGYGLCSNGVVGLKAGRTPLVVPRTDDCIALFLGSQERYIKEFERLRGCYWLNAGWIEYGWREDAHIEESAYIKNKRAEYAEKYGEDNADFLIEQEMSWIGHYNTCAYISSSVFDLPDHQAAAMRFASKNGWEYKLVDGDARMLKAMVSGDWREREFLVCPPGYKIAPAYDGSKVAAEPV